MGIDGLVHKSELSWNKVNNPESGYQVGEEVEAEVIDINHERGRMSLSIRRLQPDPWHSTVADFNVGDIIDGTVTKLVNFGAFVRVRDGLEGLIHISELSHQRVAHPGDVVHEGQSLKLRILSLELRAPPPGAEPQAGGRSARPASDGGWRPEPVRHARGIAPERRRVRNAVTRCPMRSRSRKAGSTTRWHRPSPRCASNWPRPRATMSSRCRRGSAAEADSADDAPVAAADAEAYEPAAEPEAAPEAEAAPVEAEATAVEAEAAPKAEAAPEADTAPAEPEALTEAEAAPVEAAPAEPETTPAEAAEEAEAAPAEVAEEPAAVEPEAAPEAEAAPEPEAPEAEATPAEAPAAASDDATPADAEEPKTEG